MITFKVTDTGIGLTKDQQDKLFESFSQADASTTRKYGGTGLGLSISRQIVKLLGGNIWVNSEYGKGSEFGFIIPVEKGKNTKEDISNKHIIEKNPKLKRQLSMGHQPITKEQFDKLLEELSQALQTKRPKNCEFVINKISKYSLDNDQYLIVGKISSLIYSYKYKEALDLLNDIYFS